jgi:PhzF family phenazine biosynthesis protein
MMQIPLYHIDAFSAKAFGGNPAAVCPLTSWIDDRLMQSIAAENNLAETAFFAPGDEGYDIRWFTPTDEVDLCGHATLASAYVVFEHLNRELQSVTFGSKSGPLRVDRRADLLVLDFPTRAAAPRAAMPALADALGATPLETLQAKSLVAVFGSEHDVRALKPDFEAMRLLDTFGVIATAPGDRVDFVSRFFAPRVGVPEDPATGSAHCSLTPYWASRLGKPALHAHQISARGGELWCELAGDRVLIAGHVTPYLAGSIDV